MSIQQPILPFSNDSDDSLNHSDDYHNFSLQTINEMTFELSKYHDEKISLANNNDYEITQPPCDYLFCGDGNIDPVFTDESLRILFFNIGSIPSHLDEFREQCLSTLGFDVDVIGLCETRLNDSLEPLFQLINYNGNFKSKSTSGGGLAIYIHEKFHYEPMNNVSLQMPHLQSLFVKVSQPYPFVLGIIYRPPNSNINDFFTSLEDILSVLVTNLHIPCHIMGDFNINLLHYENDNTKELINIFCSYSMYPSVLKPTRVTKHSATLIDHVWTNDLNNCMKSGIINISISDHFPVLSWFKTSRKNDKVQVVRKRSINKHCIERFKSELTNYKWEEEITSSGVDDDFDKYITTFTSLYDKNFQIKEYRIKDANADKPYITSAIRQSIKQRNKLQKLSARWPLTYARQFKKYRNILTTVIREAENKYYTETLKSNASNNRKTWDAINGLMGRCRKSKLPPHLTFDGESTTDNKKIANGFNTYFSDVAEQLAQNSTPSARSFREFLPEPLHHSMYLSPTSAGEVLEIIKNLKSTSPGYDDIHPKVVKECAEIIAPFFVHIINRSFEDGTFPSQLKVSKIIPVFKKGIDTLPYNYRPISMLTTFSKIFEKVMVKRLRDYLTHYDILTNNQFGFRTGYSTDLAIHKLCQSIYNTLDNKKYQITLFCDLAKAFDTISHTILLEKLSIYGVRGTANKLFESYLCDRRQYVSINNHVSSLTTISHGVPQGSVLGPLLFLVYINDIVRCSTKLNFLLFADDTTIYVSGQDLRELEDIVNSELVHVYNWINSNKLTLNVDKTHYMLSHNRTRSQTTNITIKVNNLEVHRVREIKFLGVIIDDTLRWKAHIDFIKLKICKLIGIIYTIRKKLNPNNIRQVYMSLAYPHLHYCAAIWGGACSTYLLGLFVTQKKLLRIMYFGSKYEHTDPYFRNNCLLKLDDIIVYTTCNFVYNALHNSPVDIEYSRTHHGIDTRTRHELRLPRCRTSHAQQCVLVRGVRSWNQLSDDAKNANTRNTFKARIKSELIARY